jgi:hypothetical protein
LRNNPGRFGKASQPAFGYSGLPRTGLFMLRIFGEVEDPQNPSFRYVVSIPDHGWRQTPASATPQ